MKKFILLLLAATTLQTFAQDDLGNDSTIYQKVEKHWRFRVSFTDKKNCGFSVKSPERFLSQKSLDRRRRYGLCVDEYDLPVTPKYLQALSQAGARICNKSKWNNTAVVETADSAIIDKVREMPFVKEAVCVWIGPDSVAVSLSEKSRQSEITGKCDTLKNFYGEGQTQIEMLGVNRLHNAGYRGGGVTIAVIDGGFYNADIIPGLSSAKILGTRNFVRPEKSVYEELSHGMMVLSCIAANVPYSLVGTAPDAEFYLLQSEDGDSEQLVEEDNWCAAVEYADSLGCDIVTSSLGYFRFDFEEMNPKYSELDGCTAINSRSASLAESRGMLVLNSAGNSGDEPWKKIGFPADARDILAVGAVDSKKCNTNFSSLGNSADGRVKPDVMAMGKESAVFDTDGTVCHVNGTSFSCPTMCGAAACLLQKFPSKRPAEIIHALQQSGDNAETPDNVYGYGIPDVMKAAAILEGGSRQE